MKKLILLFVLLPFIAFAQMGGKEFAYRKGKAKTYFGTGKYQECINELRKLEPQAKDSLWFNTFMANSYYWIATHTLHRKSDASKKATVDSCVYFLELTKDSAMTYKIMQGNACTELASIYDVAAGNTELKPDEAKKNIPFATDWANKGKAYFDGYIAARGKDNAFNAQAKYGLGNGILLKYKYDVKDIR